MNNFDKTLKKMFGKNKKSNNMFSIGKSPLKMNNMFSMNNSVNKMLGKNLNFPRMSSKPSKRDWDGDGIPNKRDCQPRNIMRQDKIRGYNIGGKSGITGISTERDVRTDEEKYGKNKEEVKKIKNFIGDLFPGIREAPPDYIVIQREFSGFKDYLVSEYKDENSIYYTLKIKKFLPTYFVIENKKNTDGFRAFAIIGNKKIKLGYGTYDQYYGIHYVFDHIWNYIKKTHKDFNIADYPIDESEIWD